MLQDDRNPLDVITDGTASTLPMKLKTKIRVTNEAARTNSKTTYIGSVQYRSVHREYSTRGAKVDSLCVCLCVCVHARVRNMQKTAVIFVNTTGEITDDANRRRKGHQRR